MCMGDDFEDTEPLLPPKTKEHGICVICRGTLVTVTTSFYASNDPEVIGNPGVHLAEEDSPIHCKDCGVVYAHAPAKAVLNRLGIRTTSIKTKKPLKKRS